MMVTLKSRNLTKLGNQRSSVLNGVAAIAEQGIVSATNFSTGVIIGRVCTKEQFGLYMLGFSLLFIVLTVQTSLISLPYIVYGYRLSGSEREIYTGSTLIHQLALTILVTLGMVLLITVISFGYGPKKLGPVVWTLVFVAALILLREYTRRLFLASLRIRAAFTLNLSIAVLQIGGLLVIVHFGMLTASHAYWTIGTACGLVTISKLIWIRKEFSLRIDNLKSDFLRNWSLGKWVVIGNMSLLLSQQLYPWYLTAFYGTGATGVFAACWSIFALANPLLLGAGNFLGPETARAYSQKGANGLRQVVFSGAILLASFAILLYLTIVFFGNQLILLVYGDKYGGTGMVLSLMALSFVSLSVGPPTSLGLLAMERSLANFKVNLIALIVSLTLGLWLAKNFGVLGAAIGLLTGNTAVSVTRLFVFIKLSLTKKNYT